MVDNLTKQFLFKQTYFAQTRLRLAKARYTSNNSLPLIMFFPEVILTSCHILATFGIFHLAVVGPEKLGSPYQSHHKHRFGQAGTLSPVS